MDHLAQIRILIVDDNRQMRFLLRSILRAAGIPDVVEAEDSASALAMLHRLPIDLALIDWQMLPEDGVTLTRRIRTGEAPNAQIPIVMMTAHTERARVAAARDAGVHGIVRKPISTRLLLERLGAALTDARPFVRTGAFYGPDRRRSAHNPDYAGPLRRATDDTGEFMLDDAPLRAGRRGP